jgi:hypothetical protein
VVSFTTLPLYSQGKDRTPEPVWTLRRTEKSSTARNQTLAVQPRSLSLYRLLTFICYRLKQEFLIARFCENRNPAGCLLTLCRNYACWIRIDLRCSAERQEEEPRFMWWRRFLLPGHQTKQEAEKATVSPVCRTNTDIPRVWLTGCSGNGSRNMHFLKCFNLCTEVR